ncbi:Peroxisome biogenesis factor 10 [Nakaseomyces glabratus]|uniref:RING-type E3 ubiquitin transferase n=1 Tax=Candida glabrata TaxID=5478 RepID=A0A0W0CX42_CANGB|nr:Peroxisome biogenesis factor 10 [Nakaseomyces glabratus]KTB03270.1 Peroxisome biogenesis factor 10 [Nakaseomyces glabratus]KTB04145.1 Peroxisome biogenesis factor 10 [Nakaseomyces glabratus]KTB13865.1 Peroxisome biogenesis factor 10 [Nakaseomyces glabratus]
MVEEDRRWKLPFAGAPSIVQAHQKDEQIETMLSVKVSELLRGVRGQLFINNYQKEISVVVKLIYLGLTTALSRRTLGEEYVDLIYVNKRGSQLVRGIKRVLFVLSYTSIPYLVTKLSKKVNNKSTNNEESDDGNESTYTDILSTMIDLHLMVFYITGTYYDVFKRFWGMRYALGHTLSQEEENYRDKSSKSYKILGYIILLQHISKVKPIINKVLSILPQTKETLNAGSNGVGLKEGFAPAATPGLLTDVPENFNIDHIKLSNGKELAFIPTESRNCILCLMEMTDPSCLPCGHVFCWDCITDWTKENPECPLCRQRSYPQQVLALRA